MSFVLAKMAALVRGSGFQNPKGLLARCRVAPAILPPSAARVEPWNQFLHAPRAKGRPREVDGKGSFVLPDRFNSTPDDSKFDAMR
jgi:hypothetical protein